MRAAPLVVLGCLLALGSCLTPHKPATLIVWAWERPEDLRFLKADAAEVAVQTGFVELRGDQMRARGRGYPLRTGGPPRTVVVHVQIDPDRPLDWTPALRAHTAAAVLHYAAAVPAEQVQLDFEVRASQRQALLDLLGDVRRGLPKTTRLSMTALASWCQTETWLDAAPVDEITPMLFRMTEGGDEIMRRLAAGEDFANPRCRASLAIATDTPVRRAPPGRRVYLFNPHGWTARDFEGAKREVAQWR